MARAIPEVDFIPKGLLMRNLKSLLLISGVSAAVTVLAITGCRTKGTGDRTEGRVIDDKNITQRVEERLAQEPVYKFTDVDVKTFSGVVQLSGFVSTQEQKERAGDIAQRVEGVLQVANNISLKPEGTLTPTGRTGYETNAPNQPQKRY